MKLLIHDYAGHAFPIQLSRELARRGHVVTHAYSGGLLTPRGELEAGPQDSRTLTFREVPMSPFYRKNKYSFVKRLCYERSYGFELRNLVAELKPDLIISGQTPSEPQWRLISYAKAHHIPVVSWVQDFYSLAVEKLARKKLPLIGSLAGAWYRRLDAKCLRSSAGVVAITEDFKPLLHDFGVLENKIHVVPNWAPLSKHTAREHDNAWATDHGLAGKFVYLYSGTLAMKHNPELLVQMARNFSSDRDVRVVVITEGLGADYLNGKKAQFGLENLIILPFQPYHLLSEVLASADVLLAVLEKDAGIFSVPSKVLTYHTAERAILAAIPHGNLAARIIVSEGSGICVEPNDVAGWLDAARQLRSDAPIRAQHAAHGRAYAEREFDIERIVDRFECLTQQALSDPN